MPREAATRGDGDMSAVAVATTLAAAAEAEGLLIRGVEGLNATEGGPLAALDLRPPTPCSSSDHRSSTIITPRSGPLVVASAAFSRDDKPRPHSLVLAARRAVVDASLRCEEHFAASGVDG